MSEETRTCVDCRRSQQRLWHRYCLRWMPPRVVEPGQEACGEYQAKWTALYEGEKEARTNA